MAFYVVHTAGQIGVPLYRRKESRYVPPSVSGRARIRRLPRPCPRLGKQFLALLYFYIFYTFSVDEKSKRSLEFQRSHNVFLLHFYTFPPFNGKSPLKSPRNRWNHWDSLRFSSLRKSGEVHISKSIAMTPPAGMVIL